jgi:hypothetical protein
MNAAPETSTAEHALPEWLSIVREKAHDLRFGVIQIVVHDAKVTQIERTEKIRLSGIRDN